MHLAKVPQIPTKPCWGADAPQAHFIWEAARPRGAAHPRLCSPLFDKLPRSFRFYLYFPTVVHNYCPMMYDAHSAEASSPGSPL